MALGVVLFRSWILSWRGFNENAMAFIGKNLAAQSHSKRASIDRILFLFLGLIKIGFRLRKFIF